MFKVFGLFCYMENRAKGLLFRAPVTCLVGSEATTLFGYLDPP